MVSRIIFVFNIPFLPGTFLLALICVVFVCQKRGDFRTRLPHTHKNIAYTHAQQTTSTDTSRTQTRIRLPLKQFNRSDWKNNDGPDGQQGNYKSTSLRVRASYTKRSSDCMCVFLSRCHPCCYINIYFNCSLPMSQSQRICSNLHTEPHSYIYTHLGQ